MLRILAGLLCLVLAATVAQAQGGYRVAPGDTLQIEVLEDPSLNRTVLILPDGSFSFPLVGTVQAGGSTVASVRDTLTSGLESQFAARPNVFVAVAATAAPELPGPPADPVTQDIYVTGEVNNPGKLDATPGITLLQAIAQSGGLSRFAAGKRIELRRQDQIFYYDYFRSGKKANRIGGHTVLSPGDVVVVPQRRLFE